MKIDELITELEKVKQEHGNLETMQYDLWGLEEKVKVTKLPNGEKRCGLWLD